MDLPASQDRARVNLIESRSRPRMPLFDAAMREYAYQREPGVRPRLRAVADLDPIPTIPPRLALVPSGGLMCGSSTASSSTRAAPVFTRIVHRTDWLERADVVDPAIAAYMEAEAGPSCGDWPWRPAAPGSVAGGQHHHGAAAGPELTVEPQPDAGRDPERSCRSFSRRLLLWKIDREELAGFGGELDRAVQMPGWTNVWTMPIQNRVDMLATA